MLIPSAELISQLKRHEGFYAEPYVCPAGKATIGYGTNLEAHSGHIPFLDVRASVEKGKLAGRALVDELKRRGMRWSEANAEYALLSELNLCSYQLEQQCPAYSALRRRGDPVRADILLNMCFNMGIGWPPSRGKKGRGLLSFTNTLALVEDGRYDKAASNMLQSLWASQVKGRAVELAEQMRTGEYRK